MPGKKRQEVVAAPHAEDFHVAQSGSHVCWCDRLTDTLEPESRTHCSVSCLEAALFKGLQAAGYIKHKQPSGQKTDPDQHSNRK